MNSENRIIVIVEDDFISQSGLKEKLEEEGFQIRLVPKDAKVLDQIATHSPDIIITDIDREDILNPFKTLAAMKEDERLKAAEIFVYTDDIDVKTEVALRKLKIISYFVKSADLRYIVHASVDHFEQHEIEEEESQRLEQIGSMDLAESGIEEDDYDNYRYDEYENEDEGATPHEESNEFQDLLNDFHEGLSKQLDKAEDAHDTHYNLGVSYLEMDLLDQALQEFEKCRHAPHLAEQSMNMIGVTQRKLGQYDKAVVSFKEGYKIASDNFSKLNFLYELGDTFEAQGKLRDAYKMFANVYKAAKDFKNVRARLIALKSSIEIKNNI